MGWHIMPLLLHTYIDIYIPIQIHCFPDKPECKQNTKLLPTDKFRRNLKMPKQSKFVRGSGIETEERSLSSSTVKQILNRFEREHDFDSKTKAYNDTSTLTHSQMNVEGGAGKLPLRLCCSQFYLVFFFWPKTKRRRKSQY